MKTISVSSLDEVRTALRSRGSDFWVGSLADVVREDMPKKIATMHVEDLFASEVFSHCFVVSSSDIKGDTNQLVDEFGLGLRKKRSQSKAVPGCVFALVKDGGPTELKRRHDALPSGDRRLSTEERLRKTALCIDVVPISRLRAELGGSSGCQASQEFWLSSFVDVGAELCKKKVVTMSIEGVSAEERFGRCLIAETDDCFSATDDITDRYGLGLRSQRVRSKAAPGCVVLLLGMPFTSAAASVDAKPTAAHSSSFSLLPILEEPRTSKQKRPAMSPSPPCDTGRKADNSGDSEAPLASKRQRPSTAAPTDEEEELRFKQVCVIEKRLAALLPTLPKEELTTPFVQARLEEFMQKPKGRLDKLRMDIARIWRSYVDKAAAGA